MSASPLHPVEHHRFTSNGRHCFFRVERRENDPLPFGELDSATYRVLSRLEQDPLTPVSPALERRLRESRLIRNSWESSLDTDARDRDVVATWRARRPQIDELSLLVAQTCNMRCVYCYGDHGTYGGGGLMSRSTALAAIDWLLEASGDRDEVLLRFFGGEPLLNMPVVRAATDHALSAAAERGKEVVFELSTNGTLLDEETVRFLARNHFRVRVSIDGPPTIHDRNRPLADGRPSSSLVAAGIERLLSVLPDSTGRATLVRADELQEVRETLAAVGFRSFDILPASPTVVGQEEMAARRRESLAARLEHYGATVAELVRCARERDTAGLRRLCPDPDVLARIRDVEDPHGRRYFRCSAARSYCVADTSGDLYPCQRFAGDCTHRIGSLAEGLTDRARYLDSAVVHSLPCRSCWARYICGGGCAYDNTVASGSAFDPDPAFCDFLRATVELAVVTLCRLKSEERAFLTEQGALPARVCPLDL